MNKLKKILPVILVIIIAALTIAFRSIPKGSSWEGYKILYVQKDIPQTTVEKILISCGISNFVDLNNQHAPIMLTKDSIEEAMLKINIQSSENRYLYDRQNYFFDGNGEYILYYIPNSEAKYLDDAIALLKKQGYNNGVDNSAPYLWMLPAVCTLLAIILCFFSKNKGFYIFTAVFPCIYIFCNAFYSSALAVIILLLCIFTISNIYQRKGALKKIISNYPVMAALVVSVISAFSSSFRSGIFYLLILSASFFAMLTVSNIKISCQKRYDFNPVFIRSAKMISPYGGKRNIIMPLLLAGSVVVIAFFALGSFNLINVKSTSGVALPGKANTQDERLPDLNAFYRWNWNVLTNPYRSLNQDSSDPDTITYPRFEVVDGLIVQKNQVMNYDQSFKDSVYNSIDNLDFNSIESVIKKQGSGFTAGYINSVAYNISLFSIIMMIMCFVMLLFIYFSAMISKGGNR
ncbi:MAG: hypothetical protein K5907_09790 [Treponema sp.]|nr:hypothetical protein [Treponema sp.]